jgi:hypothetical protein
MIQQIQEPKHILNLQRFFLCVCDEKFAEIIKIRKFLILKSIQHNLIGDRKVFYELTILPSTSPWSQ